MKKIFWFLGCTLFFHVTMVLACAPALPLVSQQTKLLKVITSEVYGKSLATQMELDARVSILDITVNRDVNINLSNGCSLKGELKYDPPLSAGACPRFREVIMTTICR